MLLCFRCSFRHRWEQMIRNAQDSICAAIEEVDGGAKFRVDAWQRAEGGGGITKVMQQGKVSNAEPCLRALLVSALAALQPCRVFWTCHVPGLLSIQMHASDCFPACRPLHMHGNSSTCPFQHTAPLQPFCATMQQALIHYVSVPQTQVWEKAGIAVSVVYGNMSVEALL